jgi:hypothetical protein
MEGERLKPLRVLILNTWYPSVVQIWLVDGSPFPLKSHKELTVGESKSVTEAIVR